MKNKKYLLSAFLEKTRLLNMLDLLSGNTLVIINYHRIYGDRLETKFDSGVFGPSVTEFDRQMAFLSKHANLLSEDEVVRLARSAEPLPKKSALITFDDGYKDNYELAVPVLQKYRVPAIFFIPTDSIENTNIGWWDIIAYFIKHTGKEAIPFNGTYLKLSTPEQREKVTRLLVTHMGTTKYEESINFLTELSLLCEVDFPSRNTQAQELMNWDQIKEIANTKLLSIGSHTVSHRVLNTVSDEEELQELQDSRAFLQNKLGHEIKSIAYPVGGYRHFSDRTKNNARKAGYSIGFSFNTGVNYHHITDAFNIKRIGPVADFSTFKSTFILPRVFVQQPA